MNWAAAQPAAIKLIKHPAWTAVFWFLYRLHKSKAYAKHVPVQVWVFEGKKPIARKKDAIFILMSIELGRNRISRFDHQSGPHFEENLKRNVRKQFRWPPEDQQSSIHSCQFLPHCRTCFILFWHRGINWQEWIELPIFVDHRAILAPLNSFCWFDALPSIPKNSKRPANSNFFFATRAKLVYSIAFRLLHANAPKMR